MREYNFKKEKKQVCSELLLNYGFDTRNGAFFYTTKILNNEFFVSIEINDIAMLSRVIESSTNDEYILIDVPTASGPFIGQLKQQYAVVLEDIINKCTKTDIFQSSQAKEIITYIKSKYNDDLEYLWAKFPDNAIWRNCKNNKWYGALLTIAEKNLQGHSSSMIEVIDLRFPKTEIDIIINKITIFPGFHMNKQNWITIWLDHGLDIKEILRLIDQSYQLSLEK